MARFEVVSRRWLGAVPVGWGGVLVVTAACSGGAGMEAEASVEGRAVPVAHVDIEYSRNVAFQSSQAIAHFVYSPEANASRGTAPFSTVLTGARNAMPEPGRCQDLTSGTLPMATPIELLEAGTVTIHTTPQRVTTAGDSDAVEQGEEQGETVADAVGETAADPGRQPSAETTDALAEASASGLTAAADAIANTPSPDPVTISLAPRAFPGVSSLASGVMYTSRDRDIPLPAHAQYQVDIEGSSQVPAMSLRGTAPAYLTHVTVGGTPLEQVSQLSPGSPIDITWDTGSADDLVVVDVTNSLDGRAVLRCSYVDAAGAGTVPWVAPLSELVEDSVRAELHVHRVRLVEATATAASGPSAEGQLRFDFELTRDVEFR